MHYAYKAKKLLVLTISFFQMVFVTQPMINQFVIVATCGFVSNHMDQQLKSLGAEDPEIQLDFLLSGVGSIAGKIVTGYVSRFYLSFQRFPNYMSYILTDIISSLFRFATG